jgi:phosphoglycerate kinase
MFNKKTIEDISVKGKRVLVRVDFNVPLSNGKVSDDTRIKAALPTLNHLIENGAALILCSHLGRPKGEKNPDFSLKPAADRLSELLGKEVKFLKDCLGEEVRKEIEKIKPGDVIVLENTRFYTGEKKNDPEMAKELASFADIFVNDAFGTAHRAHASTVGVAEYLPSVAGFLLEREIQFLDKTIENPDHPFVAILGGAKVSDKIGVIRNLLSKADKVLIGGGMANTFFKAKGLKIGDSLVEDEVLDTAEELIADGGENLVLPVDVVIADAFDNDAEKKNQAVADVPDGWRILDIGPQTIEMFSKIVQSAATVVWNGPMGVFEMPNFAEGTFKVANAIANSNAISIIGGGDSAAAINQSGLTDKISHVSTGGGASLEMLEGIQLPGLMALDDK